ncbi:LuxR family quorum-sensing system transcriptional regulator CciR [Roseiarcus fermentans]|uniref:LuxR family quorum-sensing system transcriptional regulator CciR n=1 Tax=Roseiarcus fermentans TaxID=1473586 RepID=A0A366FMR5_9HYPH|nr:LuxR family transcriptional regulator [Roseiarcus fermentans]RBP15928.1 LuxR family quorum-sensing system transcriptional regulator CciR [Roseiarcus fermentans]
MKGIGLGSAATKLTDKILGYNTDDVVDIMKDIAAEYGLSHIAYLCLASGKSAESNLLTSFVTFSKDWQVRYFLKQYSTIDPILEWGRAAIVPFDWETVEKDDPVIIEFFKDALRYHVGRNGISIPVRNRNNLNSLVSFTSDAPRPTWEAFKKHNMIRLQHLAVLIDSATSVGAKIPVPSIQLSRREEQCLIWAARGKTQHEIGQILGLSPASVRSHLDTTRHKLRCLNLAHTVGVAIATGVLPAAALKESF